MRKMFTFLFCMALSLGSFSIADASVDSVYEVAVVDLKGDVKVDTDGTAKWINPWIGMKLRKDTIIKTGEDSYIEVVFDAEGLNVLRIKSNTKTTIKAASVELGEGSVMADFANITAGSSFKVKTPAAICGIRGSGMGVDHIDNMTVVSAYEHSVYVQGVDENGDVVGEEVIIPEGWKTRVLQNGDISMPDELTENEKMIFNAWVKKVDGNADNDDNKLEDEVISKDLQEKKEVSPSE